MPDDLLTTAEAAALLGISYESVRKQINRKRIKAEKRGRDYFVRRSEVERYRRESLGKVGRPKDNE